MGYFGGIVLLLGGVPGVHRGRRTAARAARGRRRPTAGTSGSSRWWPRSWFAVFAVPMLLAVPEVPPAPDRRPPAGVVGVLPRALRDDLRTLYRADRHTVWFLGASALFRDGLAAVFTFGAVLAVTVYGHRRGRRAGVRGGRRTSSPRRSARWSRGGSTTGPGPKVVIVGSLLGMIVCATVLLFLSGPRGVLGVRAGAVPVRRAGAVVVADVPVPAGPARARGRAVRAVRDHRSGGVVPRADAGRACSPTRSARTGPGSSGILVVLAAGLVALWPVRPPVDAAVAACCAAVNGT